MTFLSKYPLFPKALFAEIASLASSPLKKEPVATMEIKYANIATKAGIKLNNAGKLIFIKGSNKPKTEQKETIITVK